MWLSCSGLTRRMSPKWSRGVRWVDLVLIYVLRLSVLGLSSICECEFILNDLSCSLFLFIADMPII